MGTHEHKKRAPKAARVGILSMSSTRSIEEDKSGHWIRKEALKEGHEVVLHAVLPDDAAAIANKVEEAIGEYSPNVLLLTGGTGIAEKDVTIEAVRPLFRKELTAFGVIFAQLSFTEIDSAAILSRATAGVVGQTVVFCMPGSIKACKLACRELIFPEVGHLVAHLEE